jgi:hypothetical protein
MRSWIWSWDQQSMTLESDWVIDKRTREENSKYFVITDCRSEVPIIFMTYCSLFTVRPDWIYMRVVPYLRYALKRTSTAVYVFDFLISLLNIWKDCDLSKCKPGSKQAGGWIHFCMKRLRTMNYYQIFKIKNKKLKTYSGWCPFQGLSNGTTLMQIQSGHTFRTFRAN